MLVHYNFLEILQLSEKMEMINRNDISNIFHIFIYLLIRMLDCEDKINTKKKEKKLSNISIVSFTLLIKIRVYQIYPI
jgi:hypothetical protein